MSEARKLESSQMSAALAQIERCQAAVAQQATTEARNALMGAYLSAASVPGIKRVDCMKHLFAAQDVAAQLLEETGETRYQKVIEHCKEQASVAMTDGATHYIPAFVRKLIARKKRS